MKDDRLYLEHILEAIRRIESYTKEGFPKFSANTLIQDAVIRNLQTLTESTQRISDDLKQKHSTVEWRALAGFRNIMVHDYLAVDLVRVWGVVVNRLPILKEQVSAMLSEYSPQEN